MLNGNDLERRLRATQAHLKNVNLAFAQLSAASTLLAANFYGNVAANPGWLRDDREEATHAGFTSGCATGAAAPT